jgi:hypothetical protein
VVVIDTAAESLIDHHNPLNTCGREDSNPAGEGDDSVPRSKETDMGIVIDTHEVVVTSDLGGDSHTSDPAN